MAPKDFTDAHYPIHHDSSSSCSSCFTDDSKKPKKSVHFNEQCYLNLFTMPTKTDRANAWFTSEDLQQFKMNSKLVAKAVRDGKTVEDEDMDFGLDNQNRQKSDLKLKRRYLSWDLVMDGQDALASPLEIATQCLQVSEGSSNDAIRSATLLHLSILQDKKMAARGKRILTRRSTLVSSHEPRCHTTVSRVA
jgi:hypothetical protein